jgi:hypothetical protein
VVDNDDKPMVIEGADQVRMAQLMTSRSALGLEIRTGLRHSRGSLIPALRSAGITKASNRDKVRAWKDLDAWIVAHGGPAATRRPPGCEQPQE